MGLMEQVAANVRAKGPDCTFVRWLARRTDAEQAEITSVLSSDHPGTAIRDTLAEVWADDPPPSAPVLQRHRSGRCNCGAA